MFSESAAEPGGPIPYVMNKAFTLLAAVAACLLAACSPEKGPSNDGPVRLDDPKDFKKEYHADQVGSGISFTADGSWTASVSAASKAAAESWIDIEPKSGEAGPNTLQVTLQPNLTGKDREASIIIACLGSQTTFVVRQTAVNSEGEVPGVYFRADDNTEWTRELPEHPRKLAVRSVGGALLTLDTLRRIAEMGGGPAILDLGEALYETRGFPLDYMGAPAEYPEDGLAGWDEIHVRLTPEMVVLPRNISRLSAMAFSGAPLKSIDLSGIDSVGFAAFRYCGELSEVVAGGTLRSIGESAFEATSALQQVTIPAGVRSIGAYAFMNGAVTSLTVQPGTDTLCIGDMAFYNCEFLRTLNLGNREVHIRPQAFEKCIDLREADLKNVTEIGSMAFEECTLLSKVTLGAAKTIGGRAFAVCPALSDVVLGDGLKVIGEGAFKNCERLKSIALPVSLRRIERYAFEACDLRSFEFPENVDSLGGGIFMNNINLEYVTFKTEKLRTIPDRFLSTNKLVGMIELPESVTHIGEHAFSFCDNLASISMGGKVKSVGARAFLSCPRLGTIICHAATPPICGDDFVFSSSGHQSGQGINQCYVPAGSVEAYQNDPVWSQLERQKFLFLPLSGTAAAE